MTKKKKPQSESTSKAIESVSPAKKWPEIQPLKPIEPEGVPYMVPIEDKVYSVIANSASEASQKALNLHRSTK